MGILVGVVFWSFLFLVGRFWTGDGLLKFGGLSRLVGKTAGGFGGGGGDGGAGGRGD